MIITSNKEKYIKIDFEDEEELEDIVKNNHEYFFGPTSIYLPQTKLTTRGEVGTIPDAIVVDIVSEEWFIVEVERSIHGTWEHIAPQISKQITSINNPNSVEVILSNLIDLIKEDKEMKNIFIELDIKEVDIRRKLEEIFEEMPKVAISNRFYSKRFTRMG